MKWVSISKVSDALGVSNIRSVYNRANREGWRYRERNGSREYLYASLPSTIQSKIAQCAVVSHAGSCVSVVPPKKAAIKSGKNMKIGMIRASIIGKMKSLCLTVEEFTSLYNLRRLRLPDEVYEKYHSLDDSTIYRWLKISSVGDPVELASDYGRDTDGAGEKTLTPQDKKMLTDLYFNTKQWTAAKCHRAWELITRKSVSYATIKRFYSSFPPAFHALFRIGSKELNDKFMPYQVRDYEKYKPMELWVSDHHMLDVFRRDGDRIFRPWITVFQDMRSRKIVGWYVSNSPSSYTILQALYMAICLYGCPDAVYFDNGKDYRSERLNGKTVEFKDGEKIRIAGIFQKYNIQVHFAEPYHGQSKPVERFFRTVLEEFSKTFESFVGSNTSITLQENKDYYKHVKNNVTLTIAELTESWSNWIRNWNATWKHRGHAMNGNTPDSVFEMGIKNRIRIDIEENYKQTLFSKFEVHPIMRNGVKFEGIDYYSPLFIALIGKKVKGSSMKYKIIRDIADIGRVFVYDFDDNLICEATNTILFGEGKTEEDIRSVKKKRKEIKKYLGGYIEASNTLAGHTLEEQIANSQPKQEIEVYKPLKKASGYNYWTH